MRLLDNVRNPRTIALLLCGLLLAGILVGVALSLVIPAKSSASTPRETPNFQIAATAHP